MSDYWRKRETTHLAKLIKDEEKYKREIDKIYRRMLDNAQKEIDAFYGKYADKEGISITEAKKRVSQLDIEAYERKAERYVKDKTFTPEANAEMRLYNATMKINRLEMLKANIGLELIEGGFHLDAFMSEILQGRTMEELERQAGILGKTIKNNAQLAHAIVNQSWHGATFSQRVWFNMAQMRGDLGKLLENGMIQGKNARVLAKELYQYYLGNPTLKNGRAGAKYAAERLMRTELARVQTEAQKQSFEKNGFSQYRFIVNGGCCDKCRAIASHNAGIYDLKDMRPGENASPVHPHCRCSCAAYEDSNEYEAWLDYLDKGGTTISWNEYRKNGGPIVLPNKNGNAPENTISKEEQEYIDRFESIVGRKPNSNEMGYTDSDFDEYFLFGKFPEKQKTIATDFSNMSLKELKSYADTKLVTKIDSLDGVKTDYARQAIRTIKEFENKMGGTLPELTVKFGKSHAGAYAYYDPKDKTLYLAKSGNLEEKQLRDNERSMEKHGRPRNSTTTYSGTLWHELAHAIDHDTGENLSRYISNDKDLMREAFRISLYAASLPAIGSPRASEAFAENFAAYMEGADTAKDVPQAVIDIIEKYFERKRRGL